jgi:type IV pilus assembly protein PilC
VKLRGQIRSAMAYPTVVCVLVLLIVTAMLMFIVPMFQGLYADLGGSLPLPTKLLLAVSAFLKKLWFIILPVMVAGVFMFRRWIGTEKGRAAWDVFKLRMPVFGGLVHKTALARFTRNFSALLRSGVPILQSLQIVSDTAGNAVVKKGVLEIQSSVQEGVSMAEPMARFPTVFPPMVVQMTAVGEETGALDDMLAKIADFYEDEVEATVSALTSLIEPLLIVVMGIAVGGMLIALYMPMFNVINLIQ